MKFFLVAMSLAALAITSEASPCPAGWHHEASTNKCYHVSSFTMAWDTATYYCRSVAYLCYTPKVAEPRTLVDFQAMQNALGALGAGDVWVGLNDGLTEGKYLCASDSFDVTSILTANNMWSPPNPDNWSNWGAIPVDEDCVGMRPGSGGHKLVDWHCNYNSGWWKKAFCEFEL